MNCSRSGLEIKAKHDAADKAEHEARVAALDAKAGLGGNRALAEYIISLEDKIALVDGYTDRLAERIDEGMHGSGRFG
jgi:hypothetical protein